MNKLVILCLVLALFQCAFAYNRVRIEDIKVLHLYRGRSTIGYKPIEQQTCLNQRNTLCDYYRPDYVRCNNVGFSNGQVIWRCEAQFKRGVTFDGLNVSCETWPGTVPAQGYVIDGSCGLRYTLRRI